MASILMLDRAIDTYLANVRTKCGHTADNYRHALFQFYKTTRNKPVASVTKQDLLNSLAGLRAEGLSDRTCHNRIAEVVTFLRHFGLTNVTLRIKFTEKKVRAYREDELHALFAAATKEESLLFQFFLCTGAREQEVMNAEWSDIDFTDGIYTVTAKAGWTPKDYEERELPLPDGLVAKLRERQRDGTSLLIFPTREGKLDGHMLRKLKDLAARAGVPDAKLHKFRKTMATLLHRNGTDARTIQRRLGHSSLETTLRYLEGQDPRSQRSRQQANSTFGVFAG